MNETTKVEKVGQGAYILSDGKRSVTVDRFPFGWVAAAEWDRCIMSDPLSTRREALEVAAMMLVRANE